MTAKQKAHTQQPARSAHGPTQQPKDMGFVLAWLLLPVVLICFAIYKYSVARARMGYRQVRYDG
jgi:hypothetical protein